MKKLLTFGCSYTDEKYIELTLKYPQLIDTIKDNDGNTPLHIASREGHINIAEYLLKNNANIEKLNKFKQKCAFDLKDVKTCYR